MQMQNNFIVFLQFVYKDSYNRGLKFARFPHAY